MMSRLPQEARQGRGDRGKTRSAVNDATVQCPVLQCRVQDYSAELQQCKQGLAHCTSETRGRIFKSLVAGSRPIILAL